VNPDSDPTLSQAPARNRARWLLAAVTIVIVVGGALLWRFTPLVDWATPERLAGHLGLLQQNWWGPIAVLALYVIGGLIVFPVTLLIAATAVMFDPLMAVALAFAGVLANAVVTHAIGAKLIRATVHAAFGRTVQRVNAALADRGVIAVAIIRTIPIAPFTFVNVAMGAVGVRLRDYLLGTALGITPGIAAFTLLGRQLREFLSRPTVGNVALLIAAIAGWIGLSLLLQSLISRRNARTKQQNRRDN
jgi:uncharacterized membrane protein YdjX (TVP38/TMEM64 family)